MTDHAKETNAATKSDDDIEQSASPSTRTKGPQNKNNAALMVVVLILLIAFLMLNLHWVAAVPNYQAQTQLDARNLSGAQWWLNVAQTLSPYNAESEYLLGRLRRRQGDLKDAGEHLSVARDLGFADDKIERERQLVSAQLGDLPDDPNAVSRLIDGAAWDSADIYEAFTIGALKSHKYELAQPLLYEWTQMFLDDPRPHYYQGLGEGVFHEWRRAEEAFRHALQLDPQYYQAMIGLAKVLVVMEKYDEAIILFRAAEKSPAERHAAIVGQATCLRMKGDSAAARTLVESVLADRPDMKSAMLEMAYLELDAGKFEDARKLIEPHMAAEARDYDLNRAYSDALRGCGEDELAKKYFDIADTGAKALIRGRWLASLISEKPDDLQRRYDLGAIHLDYGSEQQGIARLKGILREIPAHPASLKKLAEYYESKKDDGDEFAALAKQYRDQYEKSRTQDDEKKPEVKGDNKKEESPSEIKDGESENKVAPGKKTKDDDSNE